MSEEKIYATYRSITHHSFKTQVFLFEEFVTVQLFVDRHQFVKSVIRNTLYRFYVILRLGSECLTQKDGWNRDKEYCTWIPAPLMCIQKKINRSYCVIINSNQSKSMNQKHYIITAYATIHSNKVINQNSNLPIPLEKYLQTLEYPQFFH